jgi:arginine/ornithine N-succinyltransferase beta subunit
MYLFCAPEKNTMPTTNLTELRNRLQDQHRLLNKLNEALIRVLLQHGVSTNDWDEIFPAGKTIKQTIDYLRVIRNQALTPANIRLISVAADVSALQELSAELEEEINHHHQLAQLWRDRNGQDC